MYLILSMQFKYFNIIWCWYEINNYFPVCLLDEPPAPRSNLCPSHFVLALPKPLPSCSLPLPAEPGASRSQCGPAGPTPEFVRRRGEQGRRRAGREGRRVGRGGQARGEETPSAAAANPQRAAERWGSSIPLCLLYSSVSVSLSTSSGFV